MPREVNLDQATIEAGTIFTVGGRKWFAPEPTHDLLKDVLSVEGGTTGTNRSAQETIDIAYAQALMLLSAWDEEAKAPTGEKPELEWLHEHLTPRRASQIINDVLGEGQSPLSPDGTGTVPPS